MGVSHWYPSIGLAIPRAGKVVASGSLLGEALLQRLDAVFATAPIIPFDDSSRICFFSDCHRGIGDRADGFARNARIFEEALAYYYDSGYTYIEVGDGDELWQNHHPARIMGTYPKIYDLFHRLDRENRLHLILGNHDIAQGNGQRVWKAGILTQEGLRLYHKQYHKELFVVHGHQVDVVSDRWIRVSRLLVRYCVRYLRLLGLIHYDSPSQIIFELLREPHHQWSPLEQRMLEWVYLRRQAVIAGHTHRPFCPHNGEFPYFNAGCCVFDGYITGLEITQGNIQLVKWTTAGNQNGGSITRIPVGDPVPIRRI